MSLSAKHILKISHKIGTHWKIGGGGTTELWVVAVQAKNVRNFLWQNMKFWQTMIFSFNLQVNKHKHKNIYTQEIDKINHFPKIKFSFHNVCIVSVLSKFWYVHKSFLVLTVFWPITDNQSMDSNMDNLDQGKETAESLWSWWRGNNVS